MRLQIASFVSNRSGQVCCPFLTWDDCSERTSCPMEQTCDRSEQSSSSWNSAVLKFRSVFMTVQPPQWMEKQFQNRLLTSRDTTPTNLNSGITNNANPRMGTTLFRFHALDSTTTFVFSFARHFSLFTYKAK